MFEFQKTEIGFAFERSKQISIERLEVMIKTKALPKVYIHMCLSFLLGSLWTKFTPIFPQIRACLATLVKNAPKDLSVSVLQKITVSMKNTQHLA